MKTPQLSQDRYQSILSDTLGIILRLTLFSIIYISQSTGLAGYFANPVIILAIIGFILPSLPKRQSFWVIVAILITLKSLSEWSTQDNHRYLFNYWCIALAIAMGHKDPLKMLAMNARIFIGLAFAFAVIWKGFLSPDFRNGDYFHFIYLTDSKFQYFLQIFCQIPAETINNNYGLMHQLAESPTLQVQLQGMDHLHLIAQMTTWWTLLIESTVAIAFLSPTKKWLGPYRDWLLMTFAIVTYFVITISSFGIILMTLGYTQSSVNNLRIRRAYMATIVIIFVFAKMKPLVILVKVLGL